MPLPAITNGSSNAWMNAAVDAGIGAILKCLPPPLERRANDTPAEALDRGDLWRPERYPARSRVQGIRRILARTRRRPAPCCPADARHVRRVRAANGGMFAIAFAAPRILNEPIGCRFSSFSQISAGRDRAR